MNSTSQASGQQTRGLRTMMRALRNLKINIAMSAILACFALILGAVATLGLMSTRAADATIEYVNMLNIQQLNPISRADAQLNAARVSLGAAANYINDERQALADRELEEALAALDESELRLNDFLSASKAARGQELADVLETDFGAVMSLVREQYMVLDEGNAEDFQFILSELAPLTGALSESMAAFVVYGEDSLSENMSAYQEQVARFGSIGLLLVVIAVAMLAFIYLGMRLLVVRPLEAAAEDLSRIAQADLSNDIPEMGGNEIGQLFSAMRRMQHSLGEIVSDVRNGSDSIYNGAREIASGNADLSSRTEQQASSLQETAASMEQLTATVKQNAENAGQASALANDASGTASKGGDVVERVISTMKDISVSSRKIADITGLIDSIAFQTNILALNASVEAARAGEQGRGFAVVAGEVRNLAGRSGEAAKEIRELIDNSVRQVDEGSILVEQAGATMSEVVAAVRRVTDIMDEISAASQEQSGGIQQVSQAVSEMDEVTQQNAALVQEAAAAASSLEDQAKHLEEIVVVFKLHGVAMQRASGERAPAAARSTARGEFAQTVDGAALAQGNMRSAKGARAETEEWVEF